MNQLTPETIAQLRAQLAAPASEMPEPEYHTPAYAETCADYPYRYFSPSRPVGSWMRPGVSDYLTVDATRRGCGYLFTKEPIPFDKIISLELLPTFAAWNVVYETITEAA